MSVTGAVPLASGPAAATADARGSLGRGRRRHTAPFNVLALLFSLVWLFPVYWMVSSSFKSIGEIIGYPPTWVPSPWTLAGYREAIDGGFALHLLDSLIVTLSVVAVSMVLSLGAALAVARFRFRGRSSLLVLLIGIQMVPAGGLLISFFIYLNYVNLYGQLLGVIVAYIAPTLPFSIWMLRSFVVGVPKDIEEAALIDGCSRFKAYMKVVFPLIAPGLVATAIFAWITAWNEFLVAYVLLNNPSTYTLPVWLEFLVTPTSQIQWNEIFAGCTMFTVPVLIFFIIIQRRLVAGLTAGAVKG